MTSSIQAQTPVPPAEPAVVSVRDFVKKYGKVEAVKGISFEIERGEVFGLIGPDGAGKTSTFHVMGGVMDATAGTISVLGQTPRLARKKIGYLTQQFSLHLDLSIEENLVYSAGVREVSPEMFAERSRRYLELMSLYKFRDRLAGNLSGGMKQKLALCCALVSAPEILLLDEPTTGVDPVSRREFWDVLLDVSGEGVTTAVATPYLDEAERCSRVALMNYGRIVDMGTPRELIARLHMHRLEVRSNKLMRLESLITKSLGAPQSGTLQPNAAIVDAQEFGDRLDVLVPDVAAGTQLIQSLAAEAGDQNPDIRVSEPNLENVFVSKIRSQMQQQSVGEEERSFSFREEQLHSPDEVAIGADNIGIKFGSFQAVKAVSLQIGYGEIFGLLGANGAGKTTTIKMLCGLLTPGQGQMVLAGAKSNLRSADLRKRIGYMSQKFTLYDDLTVLENLEFYCGVYEVPEAQQREKIDWVLTTCGLKGEEKLITGSLPGGWKQRLSFGASVMHQPEILFLDEPTSGVDPMARRQLWRHIREFARHGTAVLVTTHFLEEAEHCQKLAFMVAGEIVAKGTPSEIKQSQPGKLIEIVADDIQQAARIIRQTVPAWKVSVFADSLHVNLEDPDREMGPILDALNRQHVQIKSHHPIEFSLEDAFIGIVQRASGKS